MEDEDIAKDVFQEVFINFSEIVKKTNEISSFKHYLIKVARNVCIDTKNQNKEMRNINSELINSDVLLDTSSIRFINSGFFLAENEIVWVASYPSKTCSYFVW